jgi:hypothetical protein
MENFTIEMYLSMIVIILTVLAIVVFIIYGSGAVFYGIFVITVLVMVYTWYRISGTSFFETGRTPAGKTPKKMKRTRKRKRR